MGLFERVRLLAQMGDAPSPYEPSVPFVTRAREHREDSSLSFPSLSISPSRAQVTSGTLCPHVTEEWLAEWYRDNPQVTCARCWIERKGRPIQAEDGPAARGLHRRVNAGARHHRGQYIPSGFDSSSPARTIR